MKNFRGQKYAYIFCLNTKIRLTMLCLSGFELYSRWVPLYRPPPSFSNLDLLLFSRTLDCYPIRKNCPNDRNTGTARIG